MQRCFRSTTTKIVLNTIIVGVCLLFVPVPCAQSSQTNLVNNEPINFSGKLFGHWKFDEGTGEITQDSSDNGHTGFLNSPAAWVTDEGVCASRNCLGFDGKDDHVNLGGIDVT